MIKLHILLQTPWNLTLKLVVDASESVAHLPDITTTKHVLYFIYDVCLHEIPAVERNTYMNLQPTGVSVHALHRFNYIMVWYDLQLISR